MYIRRGLGADFMLEFFSVSRKVLRCLTVCHPLNNVVCIVVLALGATTPASALTQKWSRRVVVTFHPGSSAVVSVMNAELQRLLVDADKTCGSVGLEFISVEEVIEIPTPSIHSTPRTVEVRKALVALGAPNRRVYEGVMPAARTSEHVPSDTTPQVDTVEVVLHCVPRR